MAPLVYPWQEVPLPGQALSLRPGLHWLRMPLPFALDHINLWLLDDELGAQAGFTQVDCGIASDDTRAAWQQLFDTVFAGKPLLRLVATHFHPDHLGLAAWLAAGGDEGRWQVPLLMSDAEYLMGRVLSAGHDVSGEAMATHFSRHGLAQSDTVMKVRQRGGGYYQRWVPQLPASYQRLYEGDVLHIGCGPQRRQWRVLIGRGHSPAHVCLYCEADRLLIAGDMVLPRISTNISVFDLEPEGNPLPRYLDSLRALRDLPEDTLVLPSHGLPFLGLHTRIEAQLSHHEQRLQEVLSACAAWQTAADIVAVLFPRELDAHQSAFALGEALAHLHALWFDGQLVRNLGADGIYRFMAAT